ncbi:MAG: hypothetical protein A2788_00855 [Candidatus Abawacabacteria bacterium RIFCSPHIGHO2_01_FULL_46_8]|uniref:Cell division protein FtsL n=1 Tax=Candidatus Abawacabacteria bacterium RIFCSPHIGHO2_01_FULL_46_8 TaxID=1817815 RepID=A0A1F4XJ26_9BACT|nr:MAG: hypothetical protein A2788_00855 [Candidatus Abawacabacteria bacterium RIFCSPHIGHO2_01_FULL_46_8]
MALGKQATLKVVITVGLILAIYILFAYLQNIYKAYQIDLQIEGLQDELIVINDENNKLKRSLEYLKTPAFREKSAKEQLNLKREGEEVIILKRPAEAADDGEILTPRKPADLQKLPNHLAWLTYFFGDTLAE